MEQNHITNGPYFAECRKDGVSNKHGGFRRNPGFSEPPRRHASQNNGIRLSPASKRGMLLPLLLHSVKIVGNGNSNGEFELEAFEVEFDPVQILREATAPLEEALLRREEGEVPHAERSGGDGVVALALLDVLVAREVEVLLGEREGEGVVEEVDKGAFGFPFVDWVREREGRGRVNDEVELHARDQTETVLDLQGLQGFFFFFFFFFPLLLLTHFSFLCLFSVKCETQSFSSFVPRSTISTSSSLTH